MRRSGMLGLQQTRVRFLLHLFEWHKGTVQSQSPAIDPERKSNELREVQNRNQVLGFAPAGLLLEDFQVKLTQRTSSRDHVCAVCMRHPEQLADQVEPNFRQTAFLTSSTTDS